VPFALILSISVWAVELADELVLELAAVLVLELTAELSSLTIEATEDSAELLPMEDSTELTSETMDSMEDSEATDEASEEVFAPEQPAKPIAARRMTKRIAENFFMTVISFRLKIRILPLFCGRFIVER